MADNKVSFGLSNVHIGTWEEENGAIVMGTPVHIPGAVDWAPSQDSDTYTFYADNVAYFSQYTDGPIEGDLEMALFPDSFKTTFMGYKALTDGGLAQVKNAVKKNIYMCGEIDGDKEKRRFIFYNGSLGAITRSYHTTEENIEVQTETCPITFVGDNISGAYKATYKPGDTGYSTLFTAPTAPAIAP